MDSDRQVEETIPPAYKRLWDENIGYRDGVRVLSFLMNAQAAIIFILSLVLYFTVSDAARNDRYFAENLTAGSKQVFALNRPNTSRSTLADWVSQSIVEIMTFGFNDIDQRFDISKKRFTEDGWEGFREAMLKSGLVSTVLENQQVITAAPMSIPEVAQEGIIRGKYSWVFNTRVLLTFRAGGSQRSVKKRVMVTVQSVPTSENPTGVGISEFYMY